MDKVKNKWRLRAAFVVLLLLVCVSFARPHPELEPVSTATREGRLAVFDDAWTTVDRRYYDPTFHGVDWDAQRVAFREVAAEAESAQQLYAVLRQMVGRLNDPHTRVFSPDEKFDWWHPRFVTIGLSVREIDGLATVVEVERNSAPDRAGIRRGDVIESIDGKPTQSFVEQGFRNFGSTLAARRRAFATIFYGSTGTWVDLVWLNKHNQQKRARFERYWRERELDMRVERLNREYFVMEVDAFTKPIAMRFLRSLRDKIDARRGVILDLRGNGGGDAEAMAEVASAFLGTGVDMGRFTDRSGGGFNMLTSLRSALGDPPRPSVPIVLLTSERTSSAAEIFVSALKKMNTTTVIGTQTCGCVLAIRNRHELPDGGILDVSEMDYQTPAGERLEGNGIQPDELIMIHRWDLYAKRDPVIDGALAYLHSAQLTHR